MLQIFFSSAYLKGGLEKELERKQTGSTRKRFPTKSHRHAGDGSRLQTHAPWQQSVCDSALPFLQPNSPSWDEKLWEAFLAFFFSFFPFCFLFLFFFFLYPFSKLGQIRNCSCGFGTSGTAVRELLPSAPCRSQLFVISDLQHSTRLTAEVKCTTINSNHWLWREISLKALFMYPIKWKGNCRGASPQGLTQDLTTPTLTHVNYLRDSASALPECHMTEEEMLMLL